MKVLKGEFSRTNLVVPSNTRPVSLLVKKACFDILREDIEGKKVLDLFAGSGALGIEALSRKAEEASFVDIKKSAISAIKKNLSFCKASLRAKIYFKDAFRAIKDFFIKKESFDLIFVDPPYHKGFLRKALQVLDEYDILSPSGYIIGFCDHKENLPKLIYLNLIFKKKYGQSLLLIYCKENDKESNLSGNI
ncbi:MAG: 16S rRNA (guanine(966)-N(2))-methyltransferase RsmD [Candidatus Aenigmatarchaeota archaeon]